MRVIAWNLLQQCLHMLLKIIVQSTDLQECLVSFLLLTKHTVPSCHVLFLAHEGLQTCIGKILQCAVHLDEEDSHQGVCLGPFVD